MSDYVNCPSCHGRGVIPLEEALRIEAHQLVTLSAAEAERQRERAGQNQAEVEYRLKANMERAEQRLAALQAVLSGPQPGAREAAELKARLARLEAEQADGGSS